MRILLTLLFVFQIIVAIAQEAEVHGKVLIKMEMHLILLLISRFWEHREELPRQAMGVLH